MSERFLVRPMRWDELDLAVDWAAGEGWNPGLHDAACFHAADANGFLLGMLGDKPIATISAVRYGSEFGFVGFYIVHPEFRGRGYGLRIWHAALEALRGRTIGLDGVVDQQENYKRSGFSLAHRNIRYEGIGRGSGARDEAIVPLVDLAFEQVEGFDRPFFPSGRGRFLNAWIAQPDASARGILQDGQLAGYGVMRRCRQGCKIGPLFADSPDQAERLFNHFLSNAPRDEPVYLDIPQINHAAVDLVTRHGMRSVFETARMYAGPAPTLPIDRLFGVTSFELG